ncbi:superfamily I DNA/RNA helicase [Chryseobacterium rhizosphaerae]|uniref:DNA 3'-5' helicase n=1 Tax=Chryseobacterium rhizosphaerae TaxID=395937 RepID=A0AAE3Y5N5_9FLAO|nr:ATP-dependent helicase [Chryseobacterium rhizosphaerae]MDR6525430.1 superfamily I DNA/RNA helicase [Chryseobacterium rhizosphaerae]
MFIWEKGSINDEQQNAILEDKSVLLIACPGSGKTRTLTFKIAYELSRLKTDKEFVIAITYTNNAAEEIKDRVELLGVDTTQLWIGTIHSFCMEWILKPYHLYSDRLKNGFKVCNSFDTEKLLTEICNKYSNPKVTFYDFQYYATINGTYKFTSKNSNQNNHIKAILKEYFLVLEKNNQLDFEQILFYAYDLMKSKPVISSILCKLFPFILIDEYQDTKEIQYHIISKILCANKGCSKTLIVGDPNQSIYNSLGGYPMAKKELEKLLGFELQQLSLDKNYRSSEAIINYFDYYKTFTKPIISFGNNKDYNSLITYNFSVSVGNLIEEIAKLILFNVQEVGISPNEICIVAPQWVHIASITRKLMIRLPDYNFDGPGMAPFSRDIENFWFKIARIVLTEPSPFMYVRRLRWSKEVLYEFEAVGIDITKISNKEFLKICNSIEIDENDGLTYLRFFFNQICNKLKIDISNFPLLKEHHTSFFASSESRIQRLIDEGNPFIGDIENFRKVFRQKDGITVSTIHGVKGEEYDTVIGFALLDDYIPHFNDTNGYENSKKLLYVLASRARKNLHLISETSRGINYYNPDGKSPTPHLLEYDYEYSILNIN